MADTKGGALELVGQSFSSTDFADFRGIRKAGKQESVGKRIVSSGQLSS
jgi:hypothetical protein